MACSLAECHRHCLLFTVFHAMLSWFGVLIGAFLCFFWTFDGMLVGSMSLALSDRPASFRGLRLQCSVDQLEVASVLLSPVLMCCVGCFVVTHAVLLSGLQSWTQETMTLHRVDLHPKLLLCCTFPLANSLYHLWAMVVDGACSIFASWDSAFMCSMTSAA